MIRLSQPPAGDWLAGLGWAWQYSYHQNLVNMDSVNEVGQMLSGRLLPGQILPGLMSFWQLPPLRDLVNLFMSIQTDFYNLRKVNQESVFEVGQMLTRKEKLPGKMSPWQLSSVKKVAETYSFSLIGIGSVTDEIILTLSFCCGWWVWGVNFPVKRQPQLLLYRVELTNGC